MSNALDFKVLSPMELVTTDAGHRGLEAGLAVERRKRWKPFAQRVACFEYAVAQAKSQSDLLKASHVSNALRLACGIADRSAAVPESAAKLQWNLGKTSGKNHDWRRAIVGRFRVACELELDEQMVGASERLVIHAISQRVISRLRIEGKCYRWFNTLTHCWQSTPKYDWDVELSAGGLSWMNDGQPRTLIYDHHVEGVGHNIDLCLIGCSPENLSDRTTACLAAGVMNRTTASTGFDEHCETAGSALRRIKSAFAKHKAQPKIFFVGAAVATKMAAEIWTMFKKGDLDNAANLTDDNQLAAITRWLCCL